MINILKSKLNVICNGCGMLMRDMGEWPVQFPRDNDLAGHTLQARRFACSADCRIPNSSYEKGYPVIIAIVDDGTDA